MEYILLYPSQYDTADANERRHFVRHMTAYAQEMKDNNRKIRQVSNNTALVRFHAIDEVVYFIFVQDDSMSFPILIDKAESLLYEVPSYENIKIELTLNGKEL